MINIQESYDMHSLSLNEGNFKSRESTASKLYIVQNAPTEEEAVKAVYDFAPRYIESPDGSRTIPKKSASVNERLGEANWKVTVEYAYDTNSTATSEEEEANSVSSGGSESTSPEVCFQCSTTSQTVTLPISQWMLYSRSGVAPGGGALPISQIPIGWNGRTNNEFAATGVDIPVADLREQYTRIMKYSTVRSSSWRRKMASCTGRINNGVFKGWNPGEVMFLGCSYTTPQDSDAQVKVTFDFLIRTNESNASIAGIDIGAVRGHDYVWAVTDNASASSVTGQVKYIFRSQVARYADFDILGI